MRANLQITSIFIKSVMSGSVIKKCNTLHLSIDKRDRVKMINVNKIDHSTNFEKGITCTPIIVLKLFNLLFLFGRVRSTGII